MAGAKGASGAGAGLATCARAGASGVRGGAWVCGNGGKHGAGTANLFAWGGLAVFPHTIIVAVALLFGQRACNVVASKIAGAISTTCLFIFSVSGSACGTECEFV